MDVEHAGRPRRQMPANLLRLHERGNRQRERADP